jgi:sensor histidine kinase regulating citrate/malate metabolism
MDTHNITIGEVARRLDDVKGMLMDLQDRTHELSNQMNVALGPVSELRVHVQMAQKDIDNVSRKCDSTNDRMRMVEIRAASLAGGISVLIWVISRFVKI